MNNRELIQTIALASGITLLSGCVSDLSDVGSDYTSSSSGSGSGSSSSSCGSYTDIVTSSEQSDANACGTQTSSFYAAADSALSAAIASCQQGDTSAADQYYSQYNEYVNLGRRMLESCTGSSTGGSTGGGFQDTTPTTYYNLCTNSYASGGYMYYEASCYGPFNSSTSTCTSGYTYLTNYTSQSACITARDNWLANQTAQ